jgi:thioredoxin reductase/Pyruvate/2-oxoacid:ferredoxin oxidoreductase delta subunit
MEYLSYLIYGLPLALLILWFARKRGRLERLSSEAERHARAEGLSEPVSLHPVIDPARCIGCGSCIKACPEQPQHHVLGLIDGRAQLVSPTDCIGHGACRIVCPVEAITLVFGSERRGVDIPVLSPRFETNVPGIFVAGELGGMGLIRNALEQGRQAVEVMHGERRGNGQMLDVVIVGAGPAGFSASLASLARKMRAVTLEQEQLGGAVFQYPRGKVVMTSPAQLPLIGKVKFREASKEQLLEFWQDVERKTGVGINYRERVDTIERVGDGFLVRSTKGEYRARNVLLSIGRRGTPRKLGVPGEGLPKVVYRLIDPAQYAGQRVLIVGGGDSALEAAASIAELGDTKVVLSHRGDAFDRAKPKNRTRIESGARCGRIEVLLNSKVQEITPATVSIEYGGKLREVQNDAVIVSIGGVLPTDFLKRIGINVETKYGTA